jgi:uncharacterized protein
MERRSFFKSMLALAGVAATGAAQAATSKKQKVVYHLSDKEKVKFVLGNIQNHIAGMGGPEYVEIVLVVHGPALKEFHAVAADPAFKQTVANLAAEGVGLTACANTMKAQKVDVKGLVPGFVPAAKGGVVRIAQLQSEGYIYIRP